MAQWSKCYGIQTWRHEFRSLITHMKSWAQQQPCKRRAKEVEIVGSMMLACMPWHSSQSMSPRFSTRPCSKLRHPGSISGLHTCANTFPPHVPTHMHTHGYYIYIWKPTKKGAVRRSVQGFLRASFSTAMTDSHWQMSTHRQCDLSTSLCYWLHG